MEEDLRHSSSLYLRACQVLLAHLSGFLHPHPSDKNATISQSCALKEQGISTASKSAVLKSGAGSHVALHMHGLLDKLLPAPVRPARSKHELYQVYCSLYVAMCKEVSLHTR